MCVVLAVPKGAPDITAEEWTQASLTNSNGYGIAWLQDGLVHFRKMLTFKVGTLENWRPPKPYVMHFRLATVGAEEVGMCHPFIVSNNSKLVARGRAREVLFHNGHWAEWNEWLALTYSGKGRLPGGEYSDSRAMAMMVGHYGEQILEISGAAWSQKILLFNREGAFSLLGKDWVHNEDGIIRSNTYHLDMWGYDSYNNEDSRPAFFDQHASTTYEQNQLNEGTCVDCGRDYYRYADEDTFNICYACEKDKSIGWGAREKLANRVKTKDNSKPALIQTNKCCPVCGHTDRGYNPLHVPNCCTICKTAGAVPICQGCDTHLYQMVSIASGVCDKCRNDGAYPKADMHGDTWRRIESILHTFNARVFWIPSSLMVYPEDAESDILKTEDKKTKLIYHVMGRIDNGPAIFVSGSCAESGVTCTPMDYDPKEREMMGADD